MIFGYRRYIDGLRALAVFCVILFHAGFETFSGGFIGVDIFFVISGYLITSIILKQKEAGVFSLTEFYERRARRILPALFFVIGLCIPFAYLHLIMPEDIKSFFLSLVTVSLFTSNIFFWIESGYFDPAVEHKPLVHTWSLAVEEQYYVLYPLFLLVMWRFAKRQTLTALVAIAIISFLIAQWGAYNKPAATFFLLPTRVWEILVGALVAFYFAHYPKLQLQKSLQEAGSLIGLILILCSVFAYNKETPFPSIYALAPVFGAALIILCTTESTLVGRTLSSKIFVGIGLVSYSAYLWHQPVFVFARQMALNELSILAKILLISLTFGLAFFTWYFVEKPFRSKTLFNKKRIFLLSVVTSICFVSIGFYGYFKLQENVSFSWLDGDVPRYLKNKKKGGVLKKFVECLDRDPFNTCATSNKEISKKIVIAGDSHAQVLVQAAERLNKNNQFELFDLSTEGCPFMLGMSLYVKGVVSENCDSKYQQNRMSFLATIPPAVIVLHSRFSFYINGQRFNNTVGGVEYGDEKFMSSHPQSKLEERIIQHKEALNETINQLLKLKHEVLIISGIPTNGWDPIIRLKKIEKLGLASTYEERIRLMQIPLFAVKKELDLSDQLINEVILKYPNIRLIDPKILLCNFSYCSSILENKILYANNDHLSLEGAMIVFKKVMFDLGLDIESSR